MKKMFAILAALVGFLALGSGVQAQGTTTSDMLSYCQTTVRIQSFIDAKGDTTHFSNQEWLEDGLCLGYMDGFTDGAVGMDYVSDGTVYEVTAPKQFTVRQVISAFVAYATSHPESLKETALSTVINSTAGSGIIVLKPIGVLAPSAPKQSTPKSSTQPEHDKA